MSLSDEELDALAERLIHAWVHAPGDRRAEWIAAAREAARWAEEQQGEVVWECALGKNLWDRLPDKDAARFAESAGDTVRAIRVIATTTKEGE